MTYDKLVNESVNQETENSEGNKYRLRNGRVKELEHGRWKTVCSVENVEECNHAVVDSLRQARENGYWKVVYTDDVGFDSESIDDSLYVPLDDPFDPVVVKELYDGEDFLADKLKQQTDDLYGLVDSDNLYVSELESPSELLRVNNERNWLSAVKDTVRSETDSSEELLKKFLYILGIAIVGFISAIPPISFLPLSILCYGFIFTYIVYVLIYNASQVIKNIREQETVERYRL